MVNLKYHFLILFLLVALSLSAQIKVEGNFLNAETYDEVYLYEFYGRNYFAIDTFPMEDGKFEMNLENIERGFYRVGFEGNEIINMIIGNESFSFTADLKDPVNGLQFNNSIENQFYKEYLDYSMEYRTSMYSISEEMQAILQKPDSLQDKDKLSSLNQRMESINQDRYTFLTQTQEKSKDLFIGKVASSSIYENEAASFFSKADFTDTEMTRGDMLTSKFMYYFQNHVPPNLEDWKRSANELISRAPEGSRMQEFYSFTFVQMVIAVARDYVWDIAAPYLEEYNDSRYFQYLESSLPEKPLVIGDQAPEISLTDPSGNVVNLSSLKGNVVLVDFWASWCGPCRKENPNVVRAYQEFKDKGFTVYGVSLDKDKDRWLQAIERDQLSWHHVSDLKGWQSEGASIYGVRAIPAAFLLDKEGVIIAKNLRGEALHTKLKEIFDQK